MEGSDAKDEIKDDDAMINHMDNAEVKYEDAELNVESDDMSDQVEHASDSGSEAVFD